VTDVVAAKQTACLADSPCWFDGYSVCVQLALSLEDGRDTEADTPPHCNTRSVYAERKHTYKLSRGSCPSTNPRVPSLHNHARMLSSSRLSRSKNSFSSTASPFLICIVGTCKRCRIHWSSSMSAAIDSALWRKLEMLVACSIA
jgi:hypothetical protein